MKKYRFFMLVSFSPPPTTAKIAIRFFMLVSFSPPATQLENVKKLFLIVFLLYKTLLLNVSVKNTL